MIQSFLGCKLQTRKSGDHFKLFIDNRPAGVYAARIGNRVYSEKEAMSFLRQRCTVRLGLSLQTQGKV